MTEYDALALSQVDGRTFTGMDLPDPEAVYRTFVSFLLHRVREVPGGAGLTAVTEAHAAYPASISLLSETIDQTLHNVLQASLQQMVKRQTQVEPEGIAAVIRWLAGTRERPGFAFTVLEFVPDRATDRVCARLRETFLTTLKDVEEYRRRMILAYLGRLPSECQDWYRRQQSLAKLSWLDGDGFSAASRMIEVRKALPRLVVFYRWWQAHEAGLSPTPAPSD